MYIVYTTLHILRVVYVYSIQTQLQHIYVVLGFHVKYAMTLAQKGSLPLPATADGFAVDHLEEKGRLQGNKKDFQ